MNKNKIILSALLSSMFAFNASATAIEEIYDSTDFNPNPSATSNDDMPEELKDLGQRLRYSGFSPTKLRLRSLFSTTQNVNFIINYKEWDENTKTLKAKVMSGGLQLDGTVNERILPEYATQVSISLFGRSGFIYPGVSEMRLCAYNNPIVELTDPLTPGDNIMDIGFFKNDKGELVAKIGLPDTNKRDQIYFTPRIQYNACKSFPIGEDDDTEDNTGPGDNPMVQPGYDESDGPSRR